MRLPLCLLGMLALALLLGFSTPLLAQERAQDQQQQATGTSTGRIVKIWSEQNRFTLKEIGGAEYTFQVGQDATIRLNDQDSKLADLKEGDQVTITYRMMARDINAGQPAQTAAGARGQIQRVMADQNQFILKDMSNREWTFQLVREAKVRLNERDSRLADLKEGDQVCILYEKSGDLLMARELHSSRGVAQAAEFTRGEIKSVSADQQQLILKDPTGKERTFQVSRDAKVRVNNEDRKLADLKEGEPAAVTFLYMVSDLRSRRE